MKQITLAGRCEKGKGMDELPAEILEAHGGQERWNQYERVEATIVSGGGLFPLKGVPQDSSPRRMTARLHEGGARARSRGACCARTSPARHAKG